MAGRVRRRLRPRRGGHRRRPPDRALGARGRPRRLGAGSRTSRSRGCARAPGTLTGRRAARGRGRLRGRDGAGRAGAGRPPGHGAARRGRPRRRRRPRAAGSRRTPRRSRALIGRLEGELLEQMLPQGAGSTKAAVTLANRWVTTRQLGLLLGFMGQRVLGQYDLALLSAETTPGRLLFVEENIRQTASNLGRARSGRSGPGSRSTRRPTRSSSRPTRGSGRTSRTGSSAS